MTYLSQIETIANLSGRNDKIATVAKFLTDPTFYDICALALDPMIKFGFNSIPQYIKYYCQSGLDQMTLTEAIDNIRPLIGTHHSDATEARLVNVLSRVSSDDCEVIKRIILKDLKCGVQLTSLNKSIKIYNNNHKDNQLDHIRDYPCMLTSAYSDKAFNKIVNGDNIFVQEKCDGMRFNAVVTNNEVTFYGRSGKEIDLHDSPIAEDFVKLANGKSVVFDGELLVQGIFNNRTIRIPLDRKTGNGILNKAIRQTISKEEKNQIYAVVWDILSYTDFTTGVCVTPYIERWDHLQTYFDRVQVENIDLVATWITNSQDKCYQLFNDMLDQGREGVIIKRFENLWKDARATDMIKMKGENDCDLRCVDWIEGTGRFKNMLGALVLRSDDRSVEVKVGTGFTERQRTKIKSEDVLGKVITVQYNMVVNDKNKNTKSLFLPRFVEIREDKTVTNTGDEIK